jgi:hypothetical protein
MADMINGELEFDVLELAGLKRVLLIPAIK